MKEKKHVSFWNDRRLRMVVSLLIAIIIWMAVYFMAPEQTGTISRIPVQMDYNSAAYTSLGLDVLETSAAYVSVTMTGNGSTIQSLNSSSFTAYPDYSTVRGEGTYDLPVRVVANASLDGVVLNSPVPATITVTLEKVASKTLPITVQTNGITTMEGYYMDTPVTTPSEVTVTGPETVIEKVSGAVATIIGGENTSENIVTSSGVTLVDENGEEISSVGLALNVEQVEITVPILKVAEVPLSVAYTSVPTGFDTSQLHATLSVKTIRVAGTTTRINNLTDILAGYIDLANFELGESITFDIVMPDGLINVDNVLTADVAFDMADYETKTVTVSEIRTVNLPSDMNLTVSASRINNVVLLGRSDELSQLATTSVIAQIDASDISVVSGQQNVPVSIIVPSSHSVFATGVYTVLCNVETTGAPTTAATATTDTTMEEKS